MTEEQIFLNKIEKLENENYSLKSENHKQLITINTLNKQLAIQGVGCSAITDTDLIAFAKWVDDKFYIHRLKIMPKDLTEFYLKNKASILEQYS